MNKKIVPYHEKANKVYTVCKAISAISAISSAIKSICNVKHNKKVTTTDVLILDICNIVSDIIAFIIKIIYLRKPKFDDWLELEAEIQLGTTKIRYKENDLYLDYDSSKTKEEIENFIKDINDKSTKYEYEYYDIDVDFNTIRLMICDKY